jgi:hypothetical protein
MAKMKDGVEATQKMMKENTYYGKESKKLYDVMKEFQKLKKLKEEEKK